MFPFARMTLASILLATGALAASGADDILANLKPQHPRLLVSDTTWTDLKTRRKTDATLDKFLAKLEESGRKLIDQPPVERVLTGRRLLSVSRNAEMRIILWSFDYHLTGDIKFRDRAEKEMLAVAAFTDWHPEHFLDVAEMTAGMAIGYDWLYSDLSPATRATVRDAIVEKGLKPGQPGQPNTFWYTAKMNWNQVCFGGLSLGALAVAEDNPDLARTILTAARANNPNGMEPYAPMGVFPEGPGYWSYGTSYEVLLISALQTALGTDWNIPQSPGFLQSADFIMQMTGPTRRFYNYSDGHDGTGLNSTVSWFAGYLKRPDLLYFQHDYLQRFLDAPIKPEAGGGRFLPLMAIWLGQLDGTAEPTAPLN